MALTVSPILPDPARLPGCLFAPPVDGPRSLFAQDAAGALRHISQIETGAKGLACPDCGTPLVPKNGRRMARHFAHASGEDCRTAGETALHQLAKTIVAEGGSLRLPAVTAPGPQGPVALRPATRVAFDRVEIEPCQAGLRPDLVAMKSVV